MINCKRHPDYVGQKHKHKHVHATYPEKGASYIHTHEYPCCDQSSLAAQAHTHMVDGERVFHLHPHSELPNV